MKQYFVFRKIVCADGCKVMANSKKEAIQKAKEGKDFVDDVVDGRQDWEVIETDKVLESSYEANEDKEV